MGGGGGTAAGAPAAAAAVCGLALPSRGHRSSCWSLDLKGAVPRSPSSLSSRSYFLLLPKLPRGLGAAFSEVGVTRLGDAVVAGAATAVRRVVAMAPGLATVRGGRGRQEKLEHMGECPRHWKPTEETPRPQTAVEGRSSGGSNLEADDWDVSGICRASEVSVGEEGAAGPILGPEDCPEWPPPEGAPQESREQRASPGLGGLCSHANSCPWLKGGCYRHKNP